MKINFKIRNEVGKKNHEPCSIQLELNQSGRARWNTGLMIAPKFWDDKAGRSKGTAKEDIVINRKLVEIKVALESIYGDLLLKGGKVDAQIILNTYKEKDTKRKSVEVVTPSEKRHTLIEAWNIYYKKGERLNSAGQLSDSRMNHYRTFKLHLDDFLEKKYKKSDLYLNDIEKTFADEFDMFLLEKKLSRNTANQNLKILKSVFIMCVDEIDWLVKNPMASFKVRVQQIHKSALTEEELSRIEKAKLPTQTDWKKTNFINENNLDAVRDCFLFQAYTGLAYKDASTLTTNKITKGINGGLVIDRNERSKTSEAFYIPLLDEAEALIKKYKKWSDADPEHRVMPFLSNAKMNEHLKSVQVLSKVKLKLTTHLARHTFATIAINKGVRIEIVQKILGHAKIETTGQYAKLNKGSIETELFKAYGSKRVRKFA